MRDPSVEDVRPAHAVADRMRAARDLGDHPAGDRAVGDQRVEFVGGGLADQARRVGDVAAEAFDVGQVDELLGAERLGDRAGDGVGVDVVRLTGDVTADRGDDRDELVVDQPEDHLRIDLGDVAHEAELRVTGHRPDQAGVDAADARPRSRPWTLIAATSCGLTCPCSTMRAMSTVSASVTRRPLMNVGVLAQPGHQLRDLRAAAVDDDRAHPHQAHQDDVLGEEAERVVIGGPASALPPYFTTTVLPANRRMYGSASTRVAALSAAPPGAVNSAHGASPIVASPAVSARPSATLADWTAPPDAPLVRLSIAHMAITVPVRSSNRADTWAALDPSTDFVAGGPAVTATNGSSA